MCLHRKDGQLHGSSTAQILRAMKEPEKWVKLCGKCHDGVHFCMKYLGLSWSDIYKNVKLLKTQRTPLAKEAIS
jgi:hypothetical protein